MSITRDRGVVVVQCDECHDTLEPDEPGWAVASREMRAAGWSWFKSGGEWIHHCAQCAKRLGTD